MSNNSKKILIIPAAGIGSRMQSDTPKQYIKLPNNKTILDTTLSRLLDGDFFDIVIIALNENDLYWENSIYCKNKRVVTCLGSSTRFESVNNALNSLELNHKDWVFVHDAARPFIKMSDVMNLFKSVIVSKSQAGILATKAIETVKEVIDGNIINRTINRDNIWLAQTPQMSTVNNLRNAFEFCIKNNLVSQITDESSALEIYGLNPIIVEGSKSNIKITNSEDLL